MLLPATMKLLGDTNWYLPRWLDWLPGKAPEQRSAAVPPVAAPTATATGH